MGEPELTKAVFWDLINLMYGCDRGALLYKYIPPAARKALCQHWYPAFVRCKVTPAILEATVAKMLMWKPGQATMKDVLNHCRDAMGHYVPYL